MDLSRTDSVNIAETFARLAGQWEDRSAIESGGHTLTYRELFGRAARSGRELRAYGVQAGHNVGIALRDSGEAIVLMLSLWMIGAVPVPVDFRARSAERALLAEEFDLVAIIEDRQVAEPPAYATILVDDAWSDAIIKNDDTPFFDKSRSAAAMISLTSGTTGRPLGIILDHKRLLFRLVSNRNLRPDRPAGRLLNPLPVSASGSRNHSLSQLFSGGTVLCHPPLFSISELAQAVPSRRATTLCVVPTVLRGLLELHPRASPLFPHLDLLYCFGAPTTPEEKQNARVQLCRDLVEGYSSSVSGRVSTLYGADIDARPETVGRVLPHVELQIVDGDDRPLPSGTAGNIRVRSPAVALKTYGDRTRADGDSVRNGWAYPGDLGAVDEAGFLRLLGRASDLIIRGGTNVQPSEIEAALAQHEGVREVAVVGFAKSREGEEIAAFVVPSHDLTEAALIAHCRARLVPDKRPRKFVFVAALPRNANGKIIRARLRQELESAGDDNSRPL